MMEVPTTPSRRLFCFGFGYSAQALVRTLVQEGWSIAASCRNADKKDAIADAGLEAFLFDSYRGLEETDLALSGATHILSSVPPDNQGDPVLRTHAKQISRISSLKWIGYLSTTGVYGDHGGNWVDETTPVNPSNDRSCWRVDAESAWLRLNNDHVAVHIFRLAGIYGPGRNSIDAVRAGKAKRINKRGQVFSRIHVEDIVATLKRSIEQPKDGRIYNVCDDAPSPSHIVISYACKLTGISPPPLTPYDSVTMSPMAKTFYADNRRVRNNRIKSELGVKLRYPNYRCGLKAILDQESR